MCVLMLQKQTVTAKYESDGRAAVGERQITVRRERRSSCCREIEARALSRRGRPAAGPDLKPRYGQGTSGRT